MAREEGSTVFWTHGIKTATPFYFYIWYCQQHRKNGEDSSSTLSSAFLKLKPHFETIHGNLEQ